MATPKEEGVHEGSSGKLQVKPEPEPGFLESETEYKVSDGPLLAEGASGELRKGVSHEVGAQASESIEKKVGDVDKPKLVPCDLQRRESIVNGSSSASQLHEGKNSPPAVQGKEDDASQFSQVSIVPKEETIDNGNGQRNDEKNCVEESLALSVITDKASDNPQPLQSVLAAHSNEQRIAYEAYLKWHEKGLDKLQPRRNPENGAHASQFDQRSVKAAEKPSEDGYNWRKYGQKLVRGNEFIRSYYKCTHTDCTAKRQVERSQDGHITDINYIGNHEHPKPQNNPQVSPNVQVRKTELPVATASEGTQSVTPTPGGKCETNETKQTPLSQGVASADADTLDSGSLSHNLQDEDDQITGPDLKKQKKYFSGYDDNKSHGEPKHVVQTISDVDIVNDGYRWRKYGQKFVKGNPNPRSYYRCSSTGCFVKKHVERASHDPRMVITTYEGSHIHDMPPCRTMTQNSGEADTTNATMTTRGDSRTETGENKHIGSLDMIVHIGAH
ncbi:unnamed protein product [Cuscuta campestris]|uniref:WRKY domain-containing protein n=1 Tax=Cuscuta campestris TaxID=132261 RepID=A0A484KER1_9ASTE|nr:unnamed protein product [Cuscuta campestris]